MAGEDRSDQMLSYYGAMRKTLRWYKKIAVHIIEMTVHYAYILYCQQPNAENKTSLQFREEVIQYWLNGSQDAVIQSNQSTSILVLGIRDTLPKTSILILGSEWVKYF